MVTWWRATALIFAALCSVIEDAIRARAIVREVVSVGVTVVVVRIGSGSGSGSVIGIKWVWGIGSSSGVLIESAEGFGWVRRAVEKAGVVGVETREE